MKRKYPVSHFIFGLITNLLKRFYIAVFGVGFILMGSISYIFKIIGFIILIMFLLFLILKELKQRQFCLEQKERSDENEILDVVYGVRKHDGSDPPTLDEWTKQLIQQHKNEDEGTVK